ncbi:MAG: hypothetical protein Q9227_003470 [Pyrenula ochraceoflavens]
MAGLLDPLFQKQATSKESSDEKSPPSSTETEMPAKPRLNVHSFPRPPLCKPTSRSLRILYKSSLLAAAPPNRAYWVLETTHPPTYYLPRDSLNPGLATLRQSRHRGTHCEWKGLATYWDVCFTREAGGEVVEGKVWSYENPRQGFEGIRGYLSYYASDVPWECEVDGEKIDPQEGDFYGGWITSDLEGRMKGGPGTWGW